MPIRADSPNLLTSLVTVDSCKAWRPTDGGVCQVRSAITAQTTEWGDLSDIQDKPVTHAQREGTNKHSTDSAEQLLLVEQALHSSPAQLINEAAHFDHSPPPSCTGPPASRLVASHAGCPVGEIGAARSCSHWPYGLSSVVGQFNSSSHVGATAQTQTRTDSTAEGGRRVSGRLGASLGPTDTAAACACACVYMYVCVWVCVCVCMRYSATIGRVVEVDKGAVGDLAARRHTCLHAGSLDRRDDLTLTQSLASTGEGKADRCTVHASRGLNDRRVEMDD